MSVTPIRWMGISTDAITSVFCHGKLTALKRPHCKWSDLKDVMPCAQRLYSHMPTLSILHNDSVALAALDCRLRKRDEANNEDGSMATVRKLVVGPSDIKGAWRKRQDVQSHHDTAHERASGSHQVQIKIEEAIGCKSTS